MENICEKCMAYMLDHHLIKYFKKCYSCGFTKEGYMITKAELLMGRDTKYPEDYTKEISDNLDVLLEKINVIRKAYGKPMNVSSGWRPAAVNSTVLNAAKASKHQTGLAVDIQDLDGKLFQWCLANLSLLQSLDLFLEDKRWTPTWTHLGIGAPGSGKRIFVPSAAPAIAPELWDGKYSKEFDEKV